MAKLAVVSLGCTKNLVDTEIMLGQLIQTGWELTENFGQADLIIVNTCGFIESAKEESIQQILEMSRYKKPPQGVCQKLVVAGCLVQRYLSELKKELPEVDYWVGLGEIGELSSLLQGAEITTGKKPFLNDQNLPRFQVTLKHTAYVKIAEGCSHGCSYCAIPLIKGRFRSRNLDSVIKEITLLVQAGVKEINLIAQDITMYGQDLEPKVNLKILLEEIIRQANPQWIRLLYAYPAGIDADLLSLIAKQPTICKYLDLPLQHINGRILKMMNRHEEPEVIREKLLLIRSMAPGIVLRSTFIVGFPTETEKEFMELLQFVQEGYFEHVGAFAYSREEGTKSYEYKPQIKQMTKQNRQRFLMEAQQKVAAPFLAGQVKQEKLILIDEVGPDGLAIGRTEGFAPDIDGVVYLKDFKGNSGVFIKGMIVGSDTYNLWAKEIF